ncbi:MAG TPA: GNAT family N-acetyltransferase [Solirubrobacteraceae bacterium]|jgi:hypothetical protein|nr:GNAT family N-acetyltransferase [Solirubrobacteraceae bacterium]
MSATTAHRPYSPQRRGAGAAEALRLPPGFSVSSLLDPERAETVERWLKSSPDHTLYHLRPYIDFLRRAHRAPADLLLVAREGNPLFALPVHSLDATGLDGGYSGVVFPATGSEGPLRRAVDALLALLDANRGILFHLTQSTQAPAYDDRARVTLLQALFEDRGLSLERVYGRLCDLDRLPAPEQIPVAPGRYGGALQIDPDWLTGEALDAYDPDARNQIRQALRRGLRVEYVHAGGSPARTGAADEPTPIAAAYERFQPVHEQSWTRTGLLPKPHGYLPALGDAVTASGGEDLVVLVLDRDGEPLAGVLCHAYRSRAIYWSGCSTVGGLRLRANPLCLHGAIAACRKQGVSTFELGRFRAGETSPKQRDVARYKAQFGGYLVRVTAFSSTPHALARARTAQARAIEEGKRRLSVALGRARAKRG